MNQEAKEATCKTLAMSTGIGVIVAVVLLLPKLIGEAPATIIVCGAALVYLWRMEYGFAKQRRQRHE